MFYRPIFAFRRLAKMTETNDRAAAANSRAFNGRFAGDRLQNTLGVIRAKSKAMGLCDLGRCQAALNAKADLQVRCGGRTQLRQNTNRVRHK
jgi:hypothetical protein